MSNEVENAQNFLGNWKEVMEGASPPPLPPLLSRQEARIDPFFVVSPEDIRSCYPPLNSAPGPDGFSSKMLRSVPMVVLQVLLNLLMLLRRVPSCWRAARTVFIPKKEKASAPGDFRPITIASTILILVHKILSRCLAAAVPLDYRQRAFIPVDGCAENVMLLSTVLDEARMKLKPLYMATLDLTKAFDRVSTDSILRATTRLGLDPSFTDYLRELYTTFTTNLTLGDDSLLVHPSRGVRQGGPLSPILFNTVLDEWLSGLLPHTGFHSDNIFVDAMAFADDLVVLACTSGGLQSRLNELQIFLWQRGLSINPSKSLTLSLVPSGRDKK